MCMHSDANATQSIPGVMGGGFVSTLETPKSHAYGQQGWVFARDPGMPSLLWQCVPWSWVRTDAVPQKGRQMLFD